MNEIKKIRPEGILIIPGLLVVGLIGKILKVIEIFPNIEFNFEFLVLIFTGVWIILFGISFWYGLRWGWWLVLVTYLSFICKSAIHIIQAIFNVINNLFRNNPNEVGMNFLMFLLYLLSAAFFIFLYRYMFKPNVKQYFDIETCLNKRILYFVYVLSIVFSGLMFIYNLK